MHEPRRSWIEQLANIRTMTPIVATVFATLLLQVLPVSSRQVLRQLQLGVEGVALRGSSFATIFEKPRPTEETNPLLASSDLPAFAATRPEHAVPAMTLRLQQAEAELRRIEASLSSKLAKSDASVSYDELMTPLEQLYVSIGQPWDFVNHLQSVRDSPGYREAVETLQPKVIVFYQNLSQSKPIYNALLRISESPDFAKMPEARRRIVEGELLDRKLGGVGLDSTKAEEFNKLQRQLSDLSMTFSNHVLDARKAWNLTINDAARVKGIPGRALAAAADLAKQGGHQDASAAKGPWLMTLDGTLLGPVLTYAQDRSLREQLFRASTTLASSGKDNNEEVVAKILELRQKQAELLGYPNYAEKSFASKMATREQVHSLLDEMQATGKPVAEAEDKELLEFAQHADEKLSKLDPWDRSFYIEKLSNQKYGIDAEQLRVYFPYPEVVKGMFSLTERLFGVTVKHADCASPRAKASKWHDAVELYDIMQDSEVVGHVLMDPYSRPSEKRSGAWMQPLVTRRTEGERLWLPVAALVMNFPPPAADGKTPSLLSLGEAGTLFHEFGHALQHVLTHQNESSVSGINGIEWDAVEIASQFLEYWVELDRRTVYSFAKHYSTGEALPEATYQQLEKAHTFRAGSSLMGQVYLGKVDLRLHEKFELGEDPIEIGKSVAAEVLVVKPLPESRPLCSFSHIFAGGYAAGYYSYQWSKVLSADAFSAFEEGGGGLGDDVHTREVGRRFASTLLALGGGRDPGKVFKDFRGRAPTPAALLRYSGLAPVGATNGTSAKAQGV